MAVSIDLAIGSSGGGGGSLSSGFLQVSGGVPLDATLRTITDKDNNVSPLQLSTSQVNFLNTRPTVTHYNGFAGFYLQRAGGTESSPTALVNGNSIQLRFNGYDGTSFFNGATIQAVTENYSGVAAGTSLFFLTTESGTKTSRSPLILRGWSSGFNTMTNLDIIPYTGYTGDIFKVRLSGGSSSLTVDSSGNTVLGTTTASARLHVRGDGTNPVARFETSAGAETHIFRDSTQLQFGSQGNYISATANGTSSSLAGRGLLFVGLSGQGIHQFTFSSINQETSGTLGAINISASYIAGAGSALYQPLRIAYTINNSGAQTGTATGIFLNAIETNLNGMAHNLMDLQVGGVSRFRVDRGGTLNATSYIYGAAFGSNARVVLKGGSSDGTALFTNNAENNFDRLQLGGTTNAFPAIKRNGAQLDIRLADDSGFANFRCEGLNSANITNSATGIVNINAIMYASTTAVSIGHTTASARLHVRSDGTNPVATFENGAGSQVAGIGNNGFITGVRFVTLNGQSRLESGAIVHSGGVGGFFTFGQQSANAGFIFSNSSSWTVTSGTAYDIDFQNVTFGAASGNANYRKLNLAYTINNVGTPVTGVATGIFLNVTETALNGMTHNLMDLQIGNATRFRVNNAGSLFTNNFAISRDVSTGADGNIVLSNSGVTNFGLLKLGGTTNAFPAIKRNGAGIEFRLADDSNFANISANNITCNNTINVGNEGKIVGTTSAGLQIISGLTGNANVKITAPLTTVSSIASAILQVDSTTKGFLPPRMDTTQRNAITSPAKGLILFDTDVNKLFVFSGTTWEEITSV